MKSPDIIGQGSTKMVNEGKGGTKGRMNGVKGRVFGTSESVTEHIGSMLLNNNNS